MQSSENQRERGHLVATFHAALHTVYSACYPFLAPKPVMLFYGLDSGEPAQCDTVFPVESSFANNVPTQDSLRWGARACHTKRSNSHHLSKAKRYLFVV